MKSIDLSIYGIKNNPEIIYNPSYDLLYEEETRDDLEGYEKGVVTDTGAVAVDTGIFTGRSPKDKYIVRDETTKDNFWWSDQGKNDNHPITPQLWDHFESLVTDGLSGERVFVVDAYCGANESTRLSVRFICMVAWQAHFVKNMFIRPTDQELETFES